MKFRKNFERDWQWYLENKDVFTFSGSPPKEIKKGERYSAKEAFYLYDSQGKVVETTEPELLQQIFKCKESINFYIRMWAEGRADGTLPGIEFSQRYVNTFNNSITDIETEFKLLPWMVEAVEKQKSKYYIRNGRLI